MNFIIKSETFSNSSIHNINTRNTPIYIDQMPTHLVFKEVYFMLASKFSKVYHLVQQSSRMTRQNSKQSKQPYELLNTHSFYSVDELYVCTNDL